MFVERGTSTRRVLSSHDRTSRLFREVSGSWQHFAPRAPRVVLFLAVCLPTLLIGLGAGEGLNLAHGQSESNAVVSSAQNSSEEVGVSDQLQGMSAEASRVHSGSAGTRKLMRERSEPTVTGAAMHVALFVPRN